MSKKRPGVGASKRLSQSSDCMMWERVESQLSTIISTVGELQDANDEYRALSGKFAEDAPKKFLTKDELLVVVQWKFSVGKKRPALMKHLHANSEASVQKFSLAAIAQARDIPSQDYTEEDIKGAIDTLTNLKGVGPATSSAVLSMVRPDLFCYMYDECIDTFLPKRTYTLPVYLSVNEECTKLSQRLGDWTPSRIARVLWVAARVCSSGTEEDHTIVIDEESKESTHCETTRLSKRRRRN
jgi:hypothetical protein